jgi:CubicO group peptidase (beta-lactamase class C family)
LKAGGASSINDGSHASLVRNFRATALGARSLKYGALRVSSAPAWTQSPVRGQVARGGRRVRNRLAIALSVLGLCIATTSTPARAVDDARSALTADLQAIITGFLAENPQAPGVSAWVSCPPLGLEWSGAAGTVARGSDEPLTVAHTFRIASNTKTYVAATVLRLAEDGRLDLDANLAGLLAPDLAALLTADGYDLQAITVRQVLSHTAGLADHSGDDSYGAHHRRPFPRLDAAGAGGALH